MNIGLVWLNSFLDRPVTALEADEALTAAGFPIEEIIILPEGDATLDVEVTSNRGDVLSHVGCAREIAAVTGRHLVMPKPPMVARSGKASDHLRLINETPEHCPVFTAHVVVGAKVAPSPAWLVQALDSVGQRSINNAVDLTNWLTFALGQPSHVFDLSKLAGAELRIRFANANEALRTLDEKDRKLVPADLVVADAERAQSLAGVIGGADSEVSDQTTDIVLEAATWDPVVVRTAARRLGIRTDASHRFERYVDARAVLPAAELAAAMLAEITGGMLLEGVLVEGAEPDLLRKVTLRPERCSAIMGIEIPSEEIRALLAKLEIRAEIESAGLVCTIPAFRPDLSREIDLIEEVARIKGLAAIPVRDRLSLEVRGPQQTERARRELVRVLTGLGFSETVTFSFVSPDAAKPFMPEGLQAVAVDDDRRKAEPILRPSVIPSLLTCRKSNQDANASPEGGVRLFETSAVFAQTAAGESVEHRNLALLLDVPGEGAKRSFDDRQRGVRLMRGAVESVIGALVGRDVDLRIEPAEQQVFPAMDPDATAVVRVAGEILGYFGILSEHLRARHDLDVPVVVAELGLDTLLGAYPPRGENVELASFPPIERDLSVIVPEGTTWGAVSGSVLAEKPAWLESVDFVGTYRGKPLDSGEKSVTLRLTFRDTSRTLRHEDADDSMNRVLGRLERELGARVRT